MKTPKGLYRTTPTVYACEQADCPQCHGPLVDANYLNGRKTIQTMSGVLNIAYRPKFCARSRCAAAPLALPSAGWQRLAPKGCTYGYDVIAALGWQRQHGQLPFAALHARLQSTVRLSETHVRCLYHETYLPLLACHERQHLSELQALAQSSGGLLLGLDGLAPEGGEPQLWIVRELHTGWTLRSGWLASQEEATFAAFLQPIADLGLPVLATLSDKQAALRLALEHVFPQARHAYCQVHYLQNAARPVAAADEQMKIQLRQTVRAEVGELLHPKTPENAGVLTSTGLLPSPAPVAPVAPASGVLSERVRAVQAAAERETIVQDLLQRVQYLLTLKARPPFRLAGIEMVEQLQQVVRCLNQLLRQQPEPRLNQLRAGLQRALQGVHADYRELHQAADWLAQLADVLDPDGQPARTAAKVRAEWQQVLDDIERQSVASPRLQRFGASILKVSDSYAPGLFHSYDVPDLARTNNARESEFRDLKRRLIRTTGQKGAVKRLLLREGAWELIPGPSSQAETVAAIASVKLAELSQEQQRVHAHRARFRLHTRSTKRSEAQLKALVRRWKALPLTHRPKRL
jgi:Transposase, Mutator family